MLSRDRSEADLELASTTELRLWIHVGDQRYAQLQENWRCPKEPNTRWKVDIDGGPRSTARLGLIASKIVAEGGLMAKKKFKGPEIVDEIQDGLNKGLARFLIFTPSVEAQRCQPSRHRPDGVELVHWQRRA